MANTSISGPIQTVQEFLSLFPYATDREKNMLCKILEGRVEFDRQFKQYKNDLNEDLGDGQHPCCAISGGLQGHPAFLVGDDTAGMTLAHQVTGARIRDLSGNLSQSFLRFHALVNSKHIDALIHVKSTAGDPDRIAYFYHKNGGKIFREDFIKLGYKEEKAKFYTDGAWDIPKCFLDYAESQKDIYKKVQEKDQAEYERLGIKFCEEEDLDERYIRKMAVENALLDLEAVKALHKKPEIVLVLRDHVSGKQFVFTEEKKFEKMGMDERGVPAFTKQLELSGDVYPVAHRLISGERAYEKAHQGKIKGHEETDSTAGCADARQPSATISGPSVGRQRHAFRNVGAALSVGDKLTLEAEEYLTLMELKGIGVKLFAHTLCGAKEVEAHYCLDESQEKEIKGSEAFLKMAKEAEKSIYKTVMSYGKTSKEVTAYYSHKVGFPIDNLANSLSIAQVEQDEAIIRRQFPYLPLIVGITDMQKGQKGLYVKINGTYTSVPYLKELAEEGQVRGPAIPNSSRRLVGGLDKAVI